MTLVILVKVFGSNVRGSLGSGRKILLERLLVVRYI